MSPTPAPAPRVAVSGNLVILCLTVIALAMIATYVWLETTGRSSTVWLPIMIGMLGLAVPTIASVLKTSEVAHEVAEVKHQTNGATEQLIATIEHQAVLLAQSQPASTEIPGEASPFPGSPGRPG